MGYKEDTFSVMCHTGSSLINDITKKQKTYSLLQLSSTGNNHYIKILPFYPKAIC